MEKLTRRQVLTRGGRFMVGAAAAITLQPFATGCSDDKAAIAAGGESRKKIRPANIENLTITIAYDNNPHRKGLNIDWGFSCLVEGAGPPILFDTGRYDNLLLENMKDLAIDPFSPEILFLSHEHPDHVGGAKALLRKKKGRRVFMPPTFSSGMRGWIADNGSSAVAAGIPEIVTEHCLSSGEMKSFVKNEHALYIDTTSGVIVITGCAHPGIVEITARAKAMMQKDVLLVLGGFHLLQETESGIREIAREFRAMGVRYVAPTHCSGSIALGVFEEIFSRTFISCGVGKRINGSELS